MTPADLHDQAMDLSHRADCARDAGDHDDARALYAAALDLERRAAESVVSEPSRGILHRSAAWLALEVGEPGEAARLALAGLAAQGVPERVRRELRDVLAAAREQL